MCKARFERDGDVGVITLADPPLNLVSPALVDDLEAAIVEAEGAGLRAVLLRAEGENFSAGAQVAEMFRGLSEAEARKLLERFGKLFERTERFPFPTVASVQGLCLAAGLEMALYCDIIIAADNAQLGLVEAVIGAVPFGGGGHRIAERAGSGRAKEIVMTAGIYDAATFERWGIVNRVVPAAALEEKSLKQAHRLALGPTRAHAATKKVMRAYLDEGTAAADKLLREVAPPLFESEDMKHGIESLLTDGPGKARFGGK